jgi:hypothetical protein
LCVIFLLESIRLEGSVNFMKHFEGGASHKSLGTYGLDVRSFASVGDQTPVVYSVVRHYTDWTTPSSTLWTKDSYLKCEMTEKNITNLERSVVMNSLASKSCFFHPEDGVGQTEAWMPTYVSILRFPQMISVWRATVEWYWQGKTEQLGENPVPVPLCPPQIPHGLTRARTQASVVRGSRLTTWAMARPKSCVNPLKTKLV